MTKTLLSVPKRTLAHLKSMAHRRNTTVSHLMREAVEKTYGIDAGLKDDADWKDDSLLRLIGDLQGGPTDLAANHDHYLYGTPRKEKPQP